MSRDTGGPHHGEPTPGIQPPNTDGVQWHRHRVEGLTGELWSAGTSRHLRHGLHCHLARFDTELEALAYARI
jgi:hypothetical protein